MGRPLRFSLPPAFVVLALSLFGFPASLTAEEVPRYGDRLLRATETVSRAIHGRRPAA